MECILWIRHLIDSLSQFLQGCMQCHAILGRVITALDCIWLYKHIGCYVSVGAKHDTVRHKNGVIEPANSIKALRPSQLGPQFASNILRCSFSRGTHCIFLFQIRSSSFLMVNLVFPNDPNYNKLPLASNRRQAIHGLMMTRPMMKSSNGNIFRVTGPLCGEFTGHRSIPRTKASDADIWCFLWSAPE